MAIRSIGGKCNPDIEKSLHAWVHEQLDLRDSSWCALSGDAGFRRYFRIFFGGSTLLAVYSPPSTENNIAFLKIDEFLYRQDVHVPKIIAYDLDDGFFLIEDLGETLYLDCLTEENVDTLYGEALLSLLRIQQSPADETIFPQYDCERLSGELALFPRWFVEQLLSHSLSHEDVEIVSSVDALLLESALEQPKVVVHRDYHSRNIVYSTAGAPGVIDFQDAVIGPITYDLASLLKDCYIEWPAERVNDWALGYRRLALDASIVSAVSEKEFLRWFDLMGLQRHLKVLGIFSRLSLRDSKHNYLDDMPLVVKYVRDIAKRYGELRSFGDWFDAALMPLISVQTWYK